MEENINDVHNEQNNPTLRGGENIAELTTLRIKWFWESCPRKVEEDYRIQAELLERQVKSLEVLKAELGKECAKRRQDKAVTKRIFQVVKRQKGNVKRQ